MRRVAVGIEKVNPKPAVVASMNGVCTPGTQSQLTPGLGSGRYPVAGLPADTGSGHRSQRQVQRTTAHHPTSVEDVGVDHGGGNVLVTEPPLDEPVSVTLQEVRREGRGLGGRFDFGLKD